MSTRSRVYCSSLPTRFATRPSVSEGDTESGAGLPPRSSIVTHRLLYALPELRWGPAMRARHARRFDDVRHNGEGLNLAMAVDAPLPIAYKLNAAQRVED